MAHGPLRNLDAEGRALHDSWDDIARMTVLCLLLAVVVWALTSALGHAVHVASEALLHFTETDALLGGAVLLGALALGGLLRALLGAREGWRDAMGDGMNVALDNYHVTYDHEGDDPSPRLSRPALGLAGKKALTTFITLGSGGSGGLEGPVVLIGESLSAAWARIMRVRSEHELRTYQLAGIAAAVSTLLSAPFAAALFATEIAYGDRIIYRKFAYALFAGFIAYVLNVRLHGIDPLFEAPPHVETYSLGEYGATALVAVAVSAPVALAFGTVIAKSKTLADRRHPWVVSIGSSVLAGAVALALWWVTGLGPIHVLGTGETTLHAILTGDASLGAAWILAVVLVGKMITTGLTVGGGGSAGLLVPSMYLGGVSGALTAHLLNATGVVALDPALFAVVGIASALVAVVGVPLAAIALVLEVFGERYGPPAILACGVTYLLTLRLHIYKSQRQSPTPTADETG